MDELVKRLREPCPYENCVLCQQAADAIEELQKKVAEWQEDACKWNNEYYHLLDNKPRWISVEDALPEKNGRYLVRYKRDIVLDYTEVHDDEARIMRFFVGDGWRYPFLCQPELRKAEQQTVTHWMALPGLPVEENTNGK